MTVRKIWGFEAEADPSDKTHWPVELKSEAVRRLRDGAQINAVAKELGTHPALVRKWQIKDRRENGGWVETPVPFAELKVSDTASGEGSPEVASTTCRLELEGMSLSFSSRIVPEELARILGVLWAAP